MAAQAVLKIKEAEDKGKEIIREATEEVRRIAADSAKALAGQKDEILMKAKKAKADIIEAAAKKANEDCEELTRRGLEEKQAILEPAGEKLEQAIKFITERIVSV